MTTKIFTTLALLMFSAASFAGAHILDDNKKPPRCFPTGEVFGNIAVCDQYSEHLSWRLTCVYILRSHHGTVPSVCRLTPADNPNGLMIQLSLREAAPEIFLYRAQPAQTGAFVVDDEVSSPFVTQNDPALKRLGEIDSFHLIRLLAKGRRVRITFQDKSVKSPSEATNLKGFSRLLIKAVRFLRS